MKSWLEESKSRYVLNNKGKVLYYNGLSGRWYPYRWDYQYQCWNECSGVYTYRGIKMLEGKGIVKFFG